MKKIYKSLIITGTVAVLTAGAFLIVPKEKPMQESVKAEHVTITAEAENATVTSTTAPEAPEIVEVEETTIAPTEPETATVEPPAQSEQDKMLEVRNYIVANAPAGHYGIINLAFNRYPEAFYKDKVAALNICVEVTNDRTIVAKEREIKQRLLAL